MENLHNDRSFIEPEKAKNASEGAGQMMAAIGKEIDEHDVVGKIGNAYAFSQKFSTIAVILFAIVFLIIAITFAKSFATTLNSIKGENTSITEIQEDDKKVVIVDGVKEYQIQDKDGLWYRVDEDTYNSK